MLKVIKRNGEVEPFDIGKIDNAIQMAGYKENTGELLKEIYSEILWLDEENITVEEIEDIVIDILPKKIAISYSNYKSIQAYKRDYLTLRDSVVGILNQTNVEVCDENSNKNAIRSSTQRDLIAGEVSKQLTFNTILPKHISDAHKQGLIHFHDGDYFLQFIHNCNLTNIGDMLDNGTVINGKKIESPSSFEKACNIMTQIIATCTGGQYGGNSVNLKHLGKYLFRSHMKLAKKDMSSEQMALDLQDICKNGVQTIIYQLNTFMTVQGQTPFITLFMELPKEHEYYDYLIMIYNELVDQLYNGIEDEYGRKITLAFPKCIYVVDEHNSVYGEGEGSELTRAVARCTVKRMNPDIMSAKKMRELHGAVYSTMGCRSLLSAWFDENGNRKYEGRFNQGVVTLNLPRVALDSFGMEDFWKLLDERCELCKEALMCRHERLKQATSDISPIHFQHGAIARLKPGESIEPLLHGGYSTISLGYIGLYETVKVLTGNSHTEEVELALDIMKFMKEKCDQWKQETGLGFGLYGTPSEGTCETLCNKDKKVYGRVEDITDKGYYTNSYHVDVREDINMEDKLLFESKFQEISTGGAISYVEIGDLTGNEEAAYQIIDFIANNIVYAEVNVKYSSCANCGYEGIMYPNDDLVWECPQCNCKDRTKLHVPRRTCGYVGSNFWNKGKTAEIKERKEHLDKWIDEGIKIFDPVDGEGLRVSVWYKGCPFRCVGCHNSELWDNPTGWLPNIDKVVEQCIKYKKLSILGGEPLSHYNYEHTLKLVKSVREKVIDCSIYIWTGNEYEDVKDLEIWKYVDKGIFGQFKIDQKVTNPMYGSANQYIKEF